MPATGLPQPCCIIQLQVPQGLVTLSRLKTHSCSLQLPSLQGPMTNSCLNTHECWVVYQSRTAAACSVLSMPQGSLGTP